MTLVCGWGWEYRIYGHDIKVREREPPSAEETEDHAPAASLEREMSAGVPGQEQVVHAATAQETEPTSEANDEDDDCVIVKAEVITRTHLNPFQLFGVGRGDNPVKW